MRTPIIAGNWKMNKTIAEARELVNSMRADLIGLASTGKVEIVLCPPFVSIPEVAMLVSGTPIKVGAQNLFWESKGAYTGEVSAPMLNEICDYVIIGHSERRQYFGETDETVNKKIKAALASHLKPIVCVGENLAFQGLAADEAGGIVIAYEPIWAIGTGKAASGAGANAVCGLTVRGALADMYDEATAQAVRIQYGGSVNAKNAAEFLMQPEIDGALVGGASLVAADFIAICKSECK